MVGWDDAIGGESGGSHEMVGHTKDIITGLIIHRCFSPTLFAFALLHSGVGGLLELKEALILPEVTPLNPVTVLFEEPLPAHQIQWSDERKCFVFALENVKIIILAHHSDFYELD